VSKRCLTGTILTDQVSFQAWFKNDEILFRSKNKQRQQCSNTQAYSNLQIKQKPQLPIILLIILENQVKLMTQFFLHLNQHHLLLVSMLKGHPFNWKSPRMQHLFKPLFTIILDDPQENFLKGISLDLSQSKVSLKKIQNLSSTERSKTKSNTDF